ncbi:hypothetical protein DUT90_06830 [Polaribacter sp. WD7]|nr:hypothetical protein DUT90_06830 [Polaribacter sp. WD7]
MTIDLDNQLTFRFGVESEFIFGFYKNKWFAISKPTYEYFKKKQRTDNQSTKIDYTSIESIIIRHHLFLNDRAKLFVN